MSDLLLMDKINSLPHPLYVRLWGDDTRWPVADIDVETGMMRLDIVGKLQITFQRVDGFVRMNHIQRACDVR